MSFDSIVSLCRHSKQKIIAGSDLIIKTTCSSEVFAWVSDIEADSKHFTLKVQGKETTKNIEQLEAGTEIELIIHGMISSNNVIANNIESFLEYNMGEFLGKIPTKFYLIEEDYSSLEATTNIQILSYYRIIRIIETLSEIADAIQNKTDTAGALIFFSSRKITFDLCYTSSILDLVPSDAEIELLRKELFNEKQLDARLDIFKRVLTRFFYRESERERFSQFLERFRAVHEAFLADLDIYMSGFSFDKAREEFERKKLDFITKANTASSDVMNKLIAIPVGQGLLASQMKADPASGLSNQALLFAALIFAVIAVLLLISQVHTLWQIKHELTQESTTLKERANPTYKLLKEMINSLHCRLNIQLYIFPAILFLLLAASTYLNVVIYNSVNPQPAQSELRGSSQLTKPSSSTAENQNQPVKAKPTDSLTYAKESTATHSVKGDSAPNAPQQIGD